MDELRDMLWEVINIKQRVQNVSMEKLSLKPQPTQTKSMDQRSKNPEQQFSRSGVFSAQQSNKKVFEQSNRNSAEQKSSFRLTRKCVFCNGNHYHDTCEKFKTLDSRKSCLAQQKICFLCFQPTHFANQCKLAQSLKPCYHCGKNTHNKALCPVKFGSTQPSSKFNTQKPFKGRVFNNRKFQQQPSGTRQFLVDSYGEDDEDERPEDESSNDWTEEEKKQNSDTNSSDSKLHSHPVNIRVETQNVNLSANIHSVKSMFLTAVVSLTNPQDPNKHCLVRAFLDSGSERTFVSSRVAKCLELEPNYNEVLSVYAFAAEKPRHIPSQNVNIQIQLNKEQGHRIRGTRKNQEFITICANAVPFVTGNLHREALSSEDKEAIQHMSQDQFADVIPFHRDQFQPDLLIGLNCFFDLVEIAQVSVLPSGLRLIPSKLGFLLGGSAEVNRHEISNSRIDAMHFKTDMNVSMKTMNILFEPDPPLQQMPNLQELWDLNRIGISDSPYQKDDDVALEKFNQNLEFKDGRYHLTWPWISEQPDLPDNRSLALSCLRSQLKRYASNPDQTLLKACHEIIQDQLEKQIIEPVSNENIIQGHLHYIPHHPVVSPGKTTKVRIVYNASAKTTRNANSLNDSLYRGPILVPDLTGLLMRFRLFPIGIISDIAKAFLQLALHETQRDCTRFFWIKDPNAVPLDHPENLQVFRFTRVLFGSKSSPSMLNLTVDHHLSKYNTQVAQLIKQNIYVDNFIGGANSVEECSDIYNEGKAMFNDASMNLREWCSNDKEFMSKIPILDKAKTTPSPKVLGMTWDLDSDKLSIPICKENAFKKPTTKRGVVETTASIFDPLGFCSPVSLQAKLYIQKLWKQKRNWDDQLPDYLQEEWNSILKDIQHIQGHSFPRFIGLNSSSTSEVVHELICFVDGSTQAFSANVYLKTSYGENSTVNLLISKSHLAPVKGLTVPRMELLAVLIGVRLLRFCETQLKIDIQSRILWSDSQCVLHWIKTNKKLPIFVENRLKEIKQVNNIHFRFIESASNPADHATRPCHWDEFVAIQKVWLHGPEFLIQSEDSWPQFKMCEVTPELITQWELSAKTVQPLYQASIQRPTSNIFSATMESLSAKDITNVQYSTSNIQCQTSTQPVISMLTHPTSNRHSGLNLATMPAEVIEITRFSDLQRLLRTTAYVFKFISLKVWSKLSQKTRSKHVHLNSLLSPVESVKDQITPMHLKSARIFWEHQVQQSVFSTRDNSRKSNQLMKHLNPFKDENGIMRLKGRLENAPLTYDTIHPKLLPANHPFTTLVIRHAHTELFHAGVQSTLATLRQEYYIIRGRKTVRSYILSCVQCQKASPKPFKLPPMPALPKNRTNKKVPFEDVGLDYFGPITIKTSSGHNKIWICLFTCFVTRAVHLEFVLDLSSIQFINCLRRFIARRGRPKFILSDNAAQFKLADKTIHKAWQETLSHPNTLSYYSNNEITWKYITELAPWKGGLYE